MERNKFNLYGYLNLLPVRTGFLTPVFKQNGSFYIESEKDNAIDAFLPIDDNYHHFIIQDIMSAGFRSMLPGDECLFAFAHEHEVKYGTVTELTAFFQRNRILEKIDNDSTKQLVRKFMNKLSWSYHTETAFEAMQVSEDTAVYNEAVVDDLANNALADLSIDEKNQTTDRTNKNWPPVGEERQAVLQAIWQYIVDHPHIHECSIDTLSSRFHINGKLLQLAFKNRFDVTIAEFVKQQCMLKAEQLLLNSNLSVIDIASQLGYISVHSFATSFKKYRIASGKEINFLLKRLKDTH